MFGPQVLGHYSGKHLRLPVPFLEKTIQKSEGFACGFLDSFLIYRNCTKARSLRNKSVRKIKKKQISQRAGSWYDVHEADTICFMHSQNFLCVCFLRKFSRVH